MDVTKPYEFIGFGAMEVTKPYEFIGFGAMEAGNIKKLTGQAVLRMRALTPTRSARKPVWDPFTKRNLRFANAPPPRMWVHVGLVKKL